MAVKTNGFIEGTLPGELMEILVTLALSWGDVIEMNKLKVVHLSGAMTNSIFQISWGTKTEENGVRTVLVRMYGEGTDIFFNREEEIRTFECISEHEHGPQLLGQFPEGRVEEFIHARTLSAGDLRDPEVSALIAAKLRDFHNLNMPGSRNAILWERLRNWLIKARSYSSPEHAKEFRLGTLEEEIRVLESELSKDYQDIGFCHNDLQYGNIMVDDKTKSITIIDYEYASYNPVAYDIANHFCEMAANYHTDTPHVLDYGIYPDPEERRRFVQLYLSSTGHQPGETKIEQLVDDADKYALTSHLFWGLWGLISAYVNNIEFDYIEYARQRFEQYWLRKPQLIGTEGPVTNVVEANGSAT